MIQSRIIGTFLKVVASMIEEDLMLETAVNEMKIDVLVIDTIKRQC